MLKLKYFLFKFSPLKKHRKLANFTITLIKNNQKIPLKLSNLYKIKNLKLKIKGVYDRTNTITIELPQERELKLTIYFWGKNNAIFFGKNCLGCWNISLYDFNNKCIIEEETECCSCCVFLFGNILKIGKNCMLSNNIHIWGDGHSVLEYPSKKLLNKPISDIQIGEHSWIGEKVTLTKNAQIPKDCIVGIASVVTKKFDEEHCVIAGAPAKIVKRGITWNGRSPLTYSQQQNGAGERT